MRAPTSDRLVFVAALALSLMACVDRGAPTDPGGTNTPKSPSGVITVAVRLPVTSLEVGKVIAAAATPMNQSGQAVPSAPVAWSSSDTSIVSVSTGGQVSARKMGSATVYATSEGVAGQGSLMVTDSVPAKVVVSPQTANASVGGHVQLSASVATHTGRALPGHTVVWSSADSRTATVSASGVVTGAASGSARIIALASGVADTATVDVSAATIASLTVTPSSSSLASGTSTQLIAQASDASGNALTGRAVGWSTSDASVASVGTSGTVTASKVGTATIYATSEGKTASATINVSAGAVSKVVVTPGSIGLVAGGTQQLSVALSDAAGNALSAQTVSWSSSNTGVATVSASGVVSGSHPGSSTITATVSGASGTATAAVSAGSVRSVSVTPSSVTLVTGATRQLSAALTDGSGNPLTGQAVAWSSSNTSVATVSSAGLVTAVRAGSATVTAAAGGASDNSAITVTAGAVNAVSVAPGSASLVAGATQQLTAAVTDAGGSTITGATITWSSSNTGVVSVDASGLATAAHVGNATITASTGGKSGTSLFAVSVGSTNAVSVSPASGSVQAGKTLQLSATLTDVAGNTVTGRTITWTSSATAAATVASTGLVSGVAAGSTNVTAAADGNSTVAAITVTAAPPAPPPPPPPPAPA
ncbi:MAG: Ig-like domain-containing protein, partial [Gemmatimonadota bacterium]|nr:Ig-like domain-containing protein [Gemmatimonadota bacterium]